MVEGLPVMLGTAGKDGKGKQSVKLREIAQVIPRGKVLNVICGEAEVCRTFTATFETLHTVRIEKQENMLTSHSTLNQYHRPSQPLLTL